IDRIDATQPPQPRALLARGLALRALGRDTDSRAVLESAVKAAPLDYALAYELGVACERSGDDEAALAHFERAGVLRPAFAPARFSAGVHRFRRREWAQAIAHFRAVVDIDARNVEALVNLGQALAESGRAREAQQALERALNTRPDSAEVRHALGWALHKTGRAADAVPHLEAAVSMEARSDWQADLAKALADAGRAADAARAFERAVSRDGKNVAVLRAYGQWSVGHGDFNRAARLFERALQQAPEDAALPMYLAQVELLRGRWDRVGELYARREPRVLFEQRAQAVGRPYRVPRAEELAGERVCLVSEQGLGDILFFLRFAAPLREAGAKLVFAGEPRLHTLLARTGWFDALEDTFEFQPDARPVLLGDLPVMDGFRMRASIHVTPDAARLHAIEASLAKLGPRPWRGFTWRAGTPADVVAHGLYKTVPTQRVMDIARPLEGTMFALQRGLHEGEIAMAAAALGRPIHDLAAYNEDPEDALALMCLLDRYVGVSNTNMHLAVACGMTADVMVPFPPEWRWRLTGESPWFPGFRVHRQETGGDWTAAFNSLAQSLADGTTSRG
ncbi:MAG TPA: tetratricopeptide repeat protein, partial [Usitatibacter sp.]|nr:tetratricopeptide repeat protein [Usitatibacter sp.]